jgi:hypothetical protein
MDTTATGYNKFSHAADALPQGPSEERVAINFADRLVTIDDEPARFMMASGIEAYPNLIAFGESGSEEFIAVNSFGDTAEVNGFLLNYVEPVVADEENDDEPLEVTPTKVESGVITLPTSLRLRVRHVRRGPGTVRKIREDDEGKRSLFIESDSVKPGHDRSYWALNSKLRDIASY